MEYFFDNIRNNIDFFLRTKFNFSLKNYKEKPENISTLIFNQNQKKIYDSLDKKYDINLFNNSSQRNFKENIYFLNVFDKYFSKNFKNNISILDIGSKNWSYVKSEYAFFKTISSNMILNGIELDAYRLNNNLYSRLEIAKFHTKNLLNTKYIAGDFLKHNQKYDYIIWILPFITEYPLVRWGLPLKYFKPEEMLYHAYTLLNKNGEMLIINQGKEEYETQKKLNESLKLDFEYFGNIEDNFNLFKNKRFCCKFKKIN